MFQDFPFSLGYIGLVMSSLILIYYILKWRSADENAEKIVKVDSEGVTLATGRVYMGSKTTPSLIYLSYVISSYVVLYPDAIVYGGILSKHRKQLADIEEIDIDKSSWVVWLFIPMLNINHTPRIIVKFKNSNAALSFTTFNLDQLTNSLEYFEKNNIHLSNQAHKFLDERRRLSSD